MKTDSDLQRDVLDELKWEPAVTAAHLGVAACNGIITLSGHVPSYGEKSRAEAAAARVFGVKAVANELDVKLPGSSSRTDEDIAAACVNALDANDSVPAGKVKVCINDGWVTLSGELELYFQRSAVEKCVRHLIGVRGITNSITFKAAVSSDDIRVQIEAAFKRSAELDSRNVFVEAKGSTVVLTGVVRSIGELNEASLAAWAAPGVTAVDNHIRISF